MKTVVVSSNEKFIHFARTHEMFAEAHVFSLENVRVEDVEGAFVASDSLPARLAARARAVLCADGRWRRLAPAALPPGEKPGAAGADDDPVHADHVFFRVGGAYFYRHTVTPMLARGMIIDYRAGATHTGFALIADAWTLTRERDVLGVGAVVRDGRAFIARGHGEWDICVLSVDSYVEPLNDLARVLAVDTAGNGVGKALVAFRPGGVLKKGSYKRRAPARVLWYVGGGYWREATDTGTARAMGWLGRHDDDNYEKVL